jgi:hypothetical protein
MTNKPRIVYTRHARKVAKRNPVTIAMPLLALGAYLWLAIYSQQEHGYTKQERQQMERLIEGVAPVKHAGGKPRKMTEAEKRIAIMQVWNISEADLTQPVVLW